MTKIYVLHENAAWVEPLRAAFAERGLPYAEWFLHQGSVPFDRTPPDGVFYNRMSASSHTRGHRYAPELTKLTLNWLEAHGRRVVNDGRALALEIDKLGQYAALQRAGVTVPRTVAAVGKGATLEVARDFAETPFILKPNRGGKGLGVQLFHSVEQLEAWFASAAYEPPIDGAWLVQQYVAPRESFITRAEFIGGRFHYAVQVDTSDGFELCPADVCSIEDLACPAEDNEPAKLNKFRILKGFKHPVLRRYERFLADNGIEIAGIEFIEDSDGRIFTYDVNTNTNYNAAAEAEAKVPVTGMQAIARFLGEELAKLPAAVAAE